uniref:NADPH-dependent FMN reductase-like domain-containing protein n=1 Tax=Clytia hemisphaerica TaxID=252671 RepID=A0A7M5USV9_9CNID
MVSLKIVCIMSSVRDGRMAERMRNLIQKQFNEILTPKGHTIHFVDPEEYDLPVLKTPLHFYPDQSKAPEKLRQLNDIVISADAYIILTAEYNRSMPPALTNLINHLPPPSFEFKVSGMVGYSQGNLGGVMAMTAARPFLSEMGCLPVKHFVVIPYVQNEVKEDGTTANTHIHESIKKLLNQVEWWAQAAKTQRATGTPELTFKMYR